jgi:hypothetical protein
LIIKNLDGHMPIHYATLHEQTEVIDALCEKLSDSQLSHQNDDKDTPHHLAIRWKHFDALKPLLVHSTSALQIENQLKKTPLETAMNHPALFELILSHTPRQWRKTETVGTLICLLPGCLRTGMKTPIRICKILQDRGFSIIMAEEDSLATLCARELGVVTLPKEHSFWTTP